MSWLRKYFLIFSFSLCLGLPTFANPSICLSLFTPIENSRILSDQTRTFDEVARRMIRKLKSESEKDRLEIHAWIKTLKQRQALGEQLSIMEHTTLQLVIRTKFLDSTLGPQITPELTGIFEKSWQSLTGKSESLELIIDKPLPKLVLLKETIEVQRFHLLVYRADPLTLKIGDPALMKFIYKAWPVALIAISSAYTGAAVLAGIAKGYYFSAFAEYALHRWVAHASPQSQIEIENSGIYLKPEDNLTRPHLAHHLINSPSKNNDPRNYALKGADGALDPEAREEILQQLERMGIVDPEAQRTFLELSSNGTKLAPRVNKAGYLLFGVSGFALGWLTGGAHWGPSAIAISIFATSFIHINEYNHTNLHRTRADIMKSGNRFEKWFINTSLFRAVSRFHYLHHVRANTNFSVMPSGIDLLLGTARDPDVLDILNLMEAGFSF